MSRSNPAIQDCERPVVSPLIDPNTLKAQLSDSELIIVDLRWYSDRPGGGQGAFLTGHIPGAVFLDLDDDLADRSDVRRGRHPLPHPDQFVQTLARAGIGRRSFVVVYDDVAGSYAARLWWMLQWIGHDRSAVLNGGLPAWTREGFPLESGPATVEPSADPIIPAVRAGLVAELPYMQSAERYQSLLLDARAPERFLGEVEPIDFRAGHIPGAVNAPWSGNLRAGDDPVFKSAGELRKRFEFLGATDDREIICYCGSGVTACHNVLALTMAGFKNIRLYPGSWSEWIHHT
jgi:thiosulfate/3-mercaptopyruvate sulfurtransferase